LTQCYTQNEYLTKDYAFNSKDDLKKVILNDSTKKEFSFNECRYKVESDSLLITYTTKKEAYGKHFKFVTIIDTLKLKEIRSLVVSEFDSGLTTATIVVAGLVVLGVIVYSEMQSFKIY
jgi:hypothetical protein